MTTFDPHKIIRKLAEAEWVRKSLPDFEGDPPGSIGTQSMEVPFAALRVTCRQSTRSLLVLGDADDADQVAELAHQERFHLERCRCKGRHWVPEPDVEKACWRIMSHLLQDRAFDDAFWAWTTEVDTYEEAVLRAAEAWLEEKMKETHEQLATNS